MPNTRRSDCPLSCFLDHWGDKWTFIILRDLLAGPRKFSGFLESAEPLPTNLLSNRLSRLVEDGFVVKTLYQDKPKRYEYAITEQGQTLVPVMQTMVGWAEGHLDGLGDTPEELARGAKPAKAKPMVKKKVQIVKEPPASTSQGAFDF